MKSHIVLQPEKLLIDNCNFGNTQTASEKLTKASSSSSMMANRLNQSEQTDRGTNKQTTEQKKLLTSFFVVVFLWNGTEDAVLPKQWSYWMWDLEYVSSPPSKKVSILMFVVYYGGIMGCWSIHWLSNRDIFYGNFHKLFLCGWRKSESRIM